MMMFDYAGSVDKCLGEPLRFPVIHSDRLVMKLSTYTNCKLYGELTAIYHYMDMLTSNCRLLLILATASHMYNFWICILGYLSGGCIGSVAVD